MVEPAKVIIVPVITERSTLQMERDNKYFFRVDTRADKGTIKRAIEEMFPVKVNKINTRVKKGKPRRLRHNQRGRTSSYKEAIVTLKKGDSIDILG